MMTAVLAGNYLQAVSWFRNLAERETGAFDSLRLEFLDMRGNRWRYVPTADKARDIDWTDMKLIGTWGERTDAEAHELYNLVYDACRRTEVLTK
jgi:hypothetical protein